MNNLSDEAVVESWVANPYWQYLSGEGYFQFDFPCDPTELTKFRNRIGIEGVEKIFEISIKLQGKEAQEKEIIPDTKQYKRRT
jgi:transposase, IS5 family